MRQLKVFIEEVEPHLLRVADVTRIDDDYPALEAIRYWRFTLLNTGGNVLLQTTFDQGRSMDWLIDSKDYGLGDAFVSDVYEIRLEVMGYAVGQRKLANYFLRTPFQPGQRVWINVNGAMFDYTDQGTLVDGDFEWHALNTYDVFDYFQVRDKGVSLGNQAVIEDVIQETTYDDTGTLVSLLSASQTKVLTKGLRKKWALQWLTLVRDWMGTGKAKPAANLEKHLEHVSGILDLLEGGYFLDTATARAMLKFATVQLNRA